MRRAALFLLFLVAGTIVLFWTTGGWRGPLADRPAPRVADTLPVEPGATVDLSPVVPGMRLSAATRIAWTWRREPRAWTDPDSGEVVRLPSLVHWQFEAEAFEPTNEPGGEGGRFRGVAVRFYRLPETRAEADLAATGTREGVEALLSARLEADEARAQALSRRLDPTGGEESSSVGVVRLTGRVRIVEAGEGLEIEGSEVEVDPAKEEIRAVGPVAARHPACEVSGEGLVLEGAEGKERARVLAKTVVTFRAALGTDGRRVGPVGDLRPTRVTCDGEAVLAREATPTRQVARLTLHDRVRAEQSGGRMLEADILEVLASCPCAETPARRVGRAPWRLDRVEAGGAVRIDATAERRAVEEAVLLTLAADRLVHETPEGASATTVFQGRVSATLRGALSLDPGRAPSSGRLSAECDEEMRIGPAAAAEVPSGMEPESVRRVVLRGGARLSHRPDPAGPDDRQEEDEVRGRTLSFLVHQPPDAEADPVVVSFAAEGEVLLGGTRFVGRAERIVGEGLDGAEPRITAEGPGTRLSWIGFREGQRLLAGPSAEASSGGGVTAGTPWALERLEAAGRIRIATQMGGPAAGLPVRIEAETLAFERMSDLARLTGPRGGQAVLAVGEEGREDEIRAATLSLEVARGYFRASGGARGRVRVRSGTGASGFGTSRRGTPAALTLATDARVALLLRREGTGFGFAPGAPQMLRVEGPFTAEMAAEDGTTDRLEADRLEVAVVRLAEPEPRGIPSAVARAAGPGSPTVRRPDMREEVWEVVAQEMSARVEGRDLVSFEASGGVEVDGATGSVRGGSVSLDARERRLVVRARTGGIAEASFGVEGERSRVAASELRLAWDDAGPAEVVARAPASAILLRPDPAAPGRVERYTVASRGDLTLDRTTLAASGWIEVSRAVRAEGRATWTDPWSLWTESIEARGRDLLSRQGAIVERLEAAGERTTFQAGDGDDTTAVWGDRFEVDLVKRRLTVSGRPDRPVVLRRGPAEAPRLSSEYDRVVLDLETGLVESVEAPRVVVPRGPGR